MYKTTYSMGGYSSKNSLFLLIFAVKRCLKILYVSSFFPPFLLERKGLKISSSKKVRIQGWLKLAQFLLIEIWGLPTLHSFISGISSSIFKITLCSLEPPKFAYKKRHQNELHTLPTHMFSMIFAT